MKTTAIIAAGGKGKRMRGEVPKQFLRIRGEPMLTHALRPFERSRLVTGVILIVPREHLPAARALVQAAKLRKVHAIVAGGKERQDSVALGLRRVPRDTSIVVVHDGARPLVRPALIGRVITAARRYGAAVPGVPALETMKRVDARFVTATLDRDRVWAIQTPQAFRFPLLKDAFRRARRKGFQGTDEACLVERLGVKVRVVPGSRENIKITTAEDLRLAEARIAAQPRLASGSDSRSRPGREWPRIGFGYDIHPLVAGRALILGGVRVPSPCGAIGDSDADVLAHAIIDALLGAIGQGDIGTHFPAGDSRYRGIRSLVLLGRIARVVKQAGYEVGNIDATLILETPRIGPSRERMRENLASVLRLDPSRVSVKATTGKGLGEVGRGEAIACQAVAVLVRPLSRA
jgi:2-C-methyl-D-erythritol 4-phosphate cytidylyltransferase/2-C-methyl-D-erythritol 2,4-cyclodiphosphate synthase